MVNESGLTLKAEMEARNETSETLAPKLKTTKSEIDKVVEGKLEICLRFAERLSKLWNMNTSFWMSLGTKTNN